MKELTVETGKIIKIEKQIYWFQTLLSAPQKQRPDFEDLIISDMDLMVDFLEEDKIFLITDLRELKTSVPKRARDHILYQLSRHVLASAIITKSILSKIIVNLAISFKKSNYPRKLFSDDPQALEWLRELKQQHEANR